MLTSAWTFAIGDATQRHDLLPRPFGHRERVRNEHREHRQIVHGSDRHADVAGDFQIVEGVWMDNDVRREMLSRRSTIDSTDQRKIAAGDGRHPHDLVFDLNLERLDHHVIRIVRSDRSPIFASNNRECIARHAGDGHQFVIDLNLEGVQRTGGRGKRGRIDQGHGRVSSRHRDRQLVCRDRREDARVCSRQQRRGWRKVSGQRSWNPQQSVRTAIFESEMEDIRSRQLRDRLIIQRPRRVRSCVGDAQIRWSREQRRVRIRDSQAERLTLTSTGCDVERLIQQRRTFRDGDRCGSCSQRRRFGNVQTERDLSHAVIGRAIQTAIDTRIFDSDGDNRKANHAGDWLQRKQSRGGTIAVIHRRIRQQQLVAAGSGHSQVLSFVSTGADACQSQRNRNRVLGDRHIRERIDRRCVVRGQHGHLELLSDHRIVADRFEFLVETRIHHCHRNRRRSKTITVISEGQRGRPLRRGVIDNRIRHDVGVVTDGRHRELLAFAVEMAIENVHGPIRNSEWSADVIGHARRVPEIDESALRQRTVVDRHQIQVETRVGSHKLDRHRQTRQPRSARRNVRSRQRLQVDQCILDTDRSVNLREQADTRRQAVDNQCWSAKRL